MYTILALFDKTLWIYCKVKSIQSLANTPPLLIGTIRYQKAATNEDISVLFQGQGKANDEMRSKVDAIMEFSLERHCSEKSLLTSSLKEYTICSRPIIITILSSAVATMSLMRDIVVNEYLVYGLPLQRLNNGSEG